MGQGVRSLKCQPQLTDQPVVTSFSGPPLTTWVTIFPKVSEASCSRILHTEVLSDSLQPCFLCLLQFPAAPRELQSPPTGHQLVFFRVLEDVSEGYSHSLHSLPASEIWCHTSLQLSVLQLCSLRKEKLGYFKCVFPLCGRLFLHLLAPSLLLRTVIWPR